MRIAVDQSRCIGVGNCVELAPELFDQDDNGTVVLLDDELAGHIDELAAAIAACPVQALMLDPRS